MARLPFPEHGYYIVIGEPWAVKKQRILRWDYIDYFLHFFFSCRPHLMHNLSPAQAAFDTIDRFYGLHYPPSCLWSCRESVGRYAVDRCSTEASLIYGCDCEAVKEHEIARVRAVGMRSNYSNAPWNSVIPLIPIQYVITATDCSSDCWLCLAVAIRQQIDFCWASTVLMQEVVHITINSCRQRHISGFRAKQCLQWIHIQSQHILEMLHDDWELQIAGTFHHPFAYLAFRWMWNTR